MPWNVCMYVCMYDKVQTSIHPYRHFKTQGIYHGFRKRSIFIMVFEMSVCMFVCMTRCKHPYIHTYISKRSIFTMVFENARYLQWFSKMLDIYNGFHPRVPPHTKDRKWARNLIRMAFWRHFLEGSPNAENPTISSHIQSYLSISNYI